MRLGGRVFLARMSSFGRGIDGRGEGGGVVKRTAVSIDLAERVFE